MRNGQAAQREKQPGLYRVVNSQGREKIIGWGGVN